jgi:hypothetical protein
LLTCLYAPPGGALLCAAAVLGDAKSIPAPIAPARAINAKRFIFKSPCGSCIVLIALLSFTVEDRDLIMKKA